MYNINNKNYHITGRQSLTKLSAHIAEYYCFQIELTKAYSIRDWRDDVKSILLKTGLFNKHTVFLFSDTQVHCNILYFSVF
jgi:dynein heavy chain